MADDFSGTDKITLRPADVGVPYRFTFAACTTADANDGSIPYGDTIDSIAVTAHTSELSTDVSTEMVGTVTLAGDHLSVTVELNYPDTTGIGTYHLKFVLTLASGAIIEYDFNRVKAVAQ